MGDYPKATAVFDLESVTPLPPGKVDIRLHGKGNANSHGARPVY